MNRNELHVIARIVLIGTGLYVFLSIFLNILSSFASLPFVASANRVKTSIWMPIALGIYAIVAAATVYFMVRCANRFSDKIVEHEPVDDTQVSWLAAAFRLVCVTAGVLFIYWSVPQLIVTVFNYIMNMNNKPSQTQIYIGMSSKTEIAKYAVMLGLSIYLAYGAPGFVRWQVKMTLKQCGKIEGQQSI
jgi:hypothetical protein